MKHRGDAGLGENDEFGLEHVESGLLMGQAGGNVW